VVNKDREWDFLYWDDEDMEDGIDDFTIKEKNKPYNDDEYDY
jgi:hypothetical protein